MKFGLSRCMNFLSKYALYVCIGSWLHLFLSGVSFSSCVTTATPLSNERQGIKVETQWNIAACNVSLTEKTSAFMEYFFFQYLSISWNVKKINWLCINLISCGQNITALELLPSMTKLFFQKNISIQYPYRFIMESHLF